MGITFTLALITISVTWFIANFVKKRRALFYRFSNKTLIIDLWHQSTILAIRIIGIIFTLEILGAGALVGAVLGTAGVIGLGISFAFKDIVENYIAGIILSIRQPFLKGDYVRLADIEGVVQRMTTRITMMKSLDGNNISIPNATIFTSNIINYSKNPFRRFEFNIGIEPNVDPIETINIGVKAMKRMEELIMDPPAFGQLEKIGSNTLDLKFFGWVDQRKYDFGQIRGLAIATVKHAIEKCGIEIPEPSQFLKIKNIDENTQEALSDFVDFETSLEAKEQITSVKQVQMVKELMAFEENKQDLLFNKSIE